VKWWQTAKWWQVAWQSIRDVGMTGLGAWIVWKQVYAPDPSPALLFFAGGCFWPAARHAVTTILSGPGSSSESPHQHSDPQSPSSSKDGGGGGE
jgi:hypothetical protein